MFSGVTGIRSHQVRMDVIGNNIANVNTTGFKGSRVTFQDVFSQTLSSGSAQSAPQQIGLGVGIASTDLYQGAGSFQLTGRELDLAIEGNGMFVLKGGDGLNVYTRVGNFDWDAEGFLVNPGTGARVQGWTANDYGEFASLDSVGLGAIQLKRGGVGLAQPTGSASLSGNLDAGAAAATEVRTTMTAYDSLGQPHSVAVVFTKGTEPNTWDWKVEGDESIGLGADGTGGGEGTLTFGSNGLLAEASYTGEITIIPPNASDAAEDSGEQTITLNFKEIKQAFAGRDGSNVLVQKADGYPMGTLESVTVDASGLVYGVFSNGFRRPMAQVAVANFSNTAGLLKLGTSTFGESPASGSPVVGAPGNGGRGRLVPGNLEMSNVDLSTEFTNMIMTQRGFQASTRVISAADEMLQDLVNLRR
jgi:flagellar hook protein FlgE